MEVVYFELNNWIEGGYYPKEEPFLTWFGNINMNICFNNEDWVEKNKLCVVRNIYDAYTNFCISAAKEWIKSNCPRLLTKHTEFLRYPDKNGYVAGQFGSEFIEYSEENIGISDVYII